MSKGPSTHFCFISTISRAVLVVILSEEPSQKKEKVTPY